MSAFVCTACDPVCVHSNCHSKQEWADRADAQLEQWSLASQVWQQSSAYAQVWAQMNSCEITQPHAWGFLFSDVCEQNESICVYTKGWVTLSMAMWYIFVICRSLKAKICKCTTSEPNYQYSGPSTSTVLESLLLANIGIAFFWILYCCTIIS